MKQFVLILISLLTLMPATVLAQYEAALTRGECGSMDVAVMISPPGRPSPSVPGVLISWTRVYAGVESLLRRDLAITLLEDGQVVACGELPESVESPGRMEVSVLPIADPMLFGFAILREYQPDETIIHWAMPGPTGASPAAPPETTSPQGYSAAEQEYLSVAGEHLVLLGESIDVFAELMSDPQVGDPVWSTRLVAALLTWQTTYDAMRDLQAPPAFAEMHRDIVAALRLYNGAADDIVAGIDDGDETRLSEALRKLEEARPLMDEALQQFNELRQERE